MDCRQIIFIRTHLEKVALVLRVIIRKYFFIVSLSFKFDNATAKANAFLLLLRYHIVMVFVTM